MPRTLAGLWIYRYARPMPFGEEICLEEKEPERTPPRACSRTMKCHTFAVRYCITVKQVVYTHFTRPSLPRRRGSARLGPLLGENAGSGCRAGGA